MAMLLLLDVVDVVAKDRERKKNKRGKTLALST